MITQLLGGPPRYKQSMRWYPSNTSLDASSSRWGTLGSPHHPTTDPSDIAMFVAT